MPFLASMHPIRIKNFCQEKVSVGKLTLCLYTSQKKISRDATEHEKEVTTEHEGR